ncbi:hypothetical protein K2173_028279 [Erythroxylum novogranatense]|uniref:Ribosomal protein L34Ae n=1 Tax=Erythroxylum novogranatense TaxID=1862640 RepID=A0AAV8U1D9_9ROSI|nr:hypothetical protein K2173_028279 [Erythroxylum novogranatense]
MTCSKETLVWLFYTLSASSFLLLLFLHFSSILLLNFVNFIGSYPIIQRRNQNGYQHSVFSDEEEQEDDEAYIYNECNFEIYHPVDATRDGETQVYVPSNINIQANQYHVQEFSTSSATVLDHDQEVGFKGDEQLSVLASAGSEISERDEADMSEQEIPTTDADLVNDSVPNLDDRISHVTVVTDKKHLGDSDENSGVHFIAADTGKEDMSFSRDEKYLIFAPTQLESRKLQVEEKEDEEIYGDSCTVGSTSKSSSEWRSSIKDSGTEDPFSSSSRRSCLKWESYTVFQKYDEEMMFLDRISAQKLHETESLKSIQVCPRSISDRIVHKFTTGDKKPSEFRHNPYHELEATYVARICLTWEALNCNYKNFQRKRASRCDSDLGCPAHIAQQFQQFQVLLQRYVENEPYEQGRRPEVYARMRLLAPKLLLVPEYRDCEDDQKDEGLSSRISSAAFLTIMEDGIKTFMTFLKADKEKTYQLLRDFFRKKRRGTVDPALLRLMKKVNKKKKMKLKDLRRSGRCIRRRKLNVDEEMEIIMGLIDLKVVSRVLRMADLREEQLHWCEAKMSKVRVSDGKLQRDSSPLFFPAH